MIRSAGHWCALRRLAKGVFAVCLSLTVLLFGDRFCEAQTNNIVVNQTFVNGPGQAHSYKIATLPASGGGTFDHLHFIATMNAYWSSPFNSTIDVVFANRDGFNWNFTQQGAPDTSYSHIVAYENSDSSVDIYFVFPGNTFTTGSYTILENLQENVYSTPTDTLGTLPSNDTLVFDSSSPSYPPVSYASFNGIFTIGIAGGNSPLTVNGGASFGAGYLTYAAPANGAIIQGNVGIGTANPGATLEINGNLKLSSGSGAALTFADGTVQTTAYAGTSCTLADLVMPDKTIVAQGGDYAESVNVDGEKATYERGDVMVIGEDSDSDVTRSTEPYSTRVAGIYSTKPGYVGRRQPGDPKEAHKEIPMAMIGIVPTKVSTENGPIHRGDLLVSSSHAGYAMKGTDRTRMVGAVVGKAMGSIDSGNGVIQVLVTLQ